MKELNTVQIISFYADEFITVCPHLREGLSSDEISEIKSELMYFMVKAVKGEILTLGIKPPNKITVTPQDITERIQELVSFEKANQHPQLNYRAVKTYRKAMNGTYKSWIK